MISQEQSSGLVRARSEFRHIPTAVEHFSPVVVDPMPRPIVSCPRMPGYRDALMLPVNAAFDGEQGPNPHPFSADTPLRAAGQLLTRRLQTLSCTRILVNCA